MRIEKDETDITNIGNMQAIKSSIADENLGLALKMVSRNLYSNPIGSFIRELVSNAVDANKDANEISPVIVHIYAEDGTYFMEVKDNGIGITPENFQNIYMSWFSSDKRHTNEKIGGWGLGSKSPLAYQDSFEIITRVDGIKYHYILANEADVPTATLIMEENTSECNGTTIRVEIKDGDLFKVHTESVRQLVYFNNVYVKNEIYYYNNNFKIYESEDFKLRNNDFPYGNEMHIVLGQVAYPINWNVLGINRINIPVGIKFNIGDLDVTLSREEINYTEKVKERLPIKIKKVAEQLSKRYEEQCKITDLFEYIRLIKDNKRPPLVIEDVKIDMSYAKSVISFAPFEGIQIKSKDIMSLFSMYNVTQLKSGKKYQQHSESFKHYHRLYSYPNLCYILKDTKENYFDTLYISNGYIFKKGKLTKSKYVSFLRILGLIEDYGHSYDTFIIKPGAAKTVHKVIKYIDNFLESRIQLYGGQAPEEWIKELKRKEEVKREETKGEITTYDIYNKRSKIKLREFIEKYKVIFYIDRTKNKQKIVEYSTLYEVGNEEFKNKTVFVMVSPTTITQISKFPNVHHISSIFKVSSYKKLLGRIRMAYIFKKQILEYKSCFDFSTYYRDMYCKIEGKYLFDIARTYHNVPDNSGNNTVYRVNLYEAFKEEIEKSVKNNNVQYIYEYEMNVLINVIPELYLLKHINGNLEVFQRYVKEKGIRKLDSKYYKSTLINL